MVNDCLLWLMSEAAWAERRRYICPSAKVCGPHSGGRAQGPMTAASQLLAGTSTTTSHLLRAVGRLALPFEKKFFCCSKMNSKKQLARRYHAVLFNPRGPRGLLLDQTDTL